MWRWYYRGGWHQSYPPLIRQSFYLWQKPMQCIGTRDPFITLSRIVKNSRLLHPLGLGPVSQCPSRGDSSQSPYGSKAWWSYKATSLIISDKTLPLHYTTNNLIRRRLILRRRGFGKRHLPVLFSYQVLSSVSQGYPWPKGRLSTCC